MGTVKRGVVGWDRIPEESILHCQDSHLPQAPVSGSSLLLCSALLPPPHSLITGWQPMCANLTTRSLLTLYTSAPSGFPEKNFLVVLIRLVVRAAVLSSMGLKFLCKRQHLPPPPKNPLEHHDGGHTQKGPRLSPRARRMARNPDSKSRFEVA